MITAEDIIGKRFDKAMGGYRQDEVDSFLKQIAGTYQEALEEKGELEGKLEILAEKIEQYREDEDSLKTALIGAQKLGDSVLREAKAQAETIIRDATIQAERTLQQTRRDIEREKQVLAQMQKEVSNFKHKLMSLYNHHLEMISSLPEQRVVEDPVDNRTPEPVQQEEVRQQEVIPEKERFVQAYDVREVEPSLPLEYEEEEYPEDDEYAFAQPAQIEDDYAPPLNDSKFGPLKFGTGYEVITDSTVEPGGRKFSKKKHR